MKLQFEGWKCSPQEATPEKLMLIERGLGRSLPDDYKKMLLTTNGGKPPRLILPLPSRGDTVISEFYSIGGKSSLNLINLAHVKYEELPKYFIPIGVDVGGNHIALGVDGAIYWKDHEMADPQSGLIKVAESFTAMLDSLKEDVVETGERIEEIAQKGTPSDIESYLSDGHEIDSKSKSGRTLCQELARFGNLPLLKICIEKGASIDGAIHLAAMNGHLQVVRYLVEEVGVEVRNLDEKNRTPKMCAFLNPEIQRYLEQRGG